MTDNEKLIEDAERLIGAAVDAVAWQILADEMDTADRSPSDEVWQATVAEARALLPKLFEKAHTPTDDEREALRAEAEKVQRGAWAEIHGQDPQRTYSVAEVKRIVYSFDNVLSSALRRSEVPEPSADVRQVLAWIDRTLGLPMYQGGELTDYADATVTALRTVRKMLNGTTRPDASWRSVEPQGEPSDAQVEVPSHWTLDDRLSDLHARYHDMPGNWLGRSECGYERCDFWDAAEFALRAAGGVR